MSAIKLVELKSENILHLNLDEFRNIISKDDLAQRSLVIISIAGAMRKGKSFLLNFFLTYAYKKYPKTKSITQPKTFENSYLIDGFSHRGGIDRHTTGIQVWSDLFLHDYSDGRKIAIIFMDTQGTFDYETKFSDCVSIFALSTLLSSVQIYNINYNIQNDHLQYLALFAEYAKLALNEIEPVGDDAPPFDTLQILVRDWNFPYQADYGLEGGKKILNKTFSSSTAEIRKTVSNIKTKFETIECFLMPHPGEVIATSTRFDGKIENVDKIFLDQVNILTAHLLQPENLQIKKINGVELKGGNFFNLIEQGYQILSKYENIPKPKTILATTAESQNFKLIDDTVNLYRNSMNDQLAQKNYLENNEIMSLHKKYFNESVKFYENADKLESFDQETDGKWKTHLQELLTRELNYFLILNEKNQTNTTEELKTLIDEFTKQKDVIKQLNEKHAQDMLDLINTFRQREEEHKECITELTRSFQQSPSAGFSFMDIVTKAIDIIPSAIMTLGLHRTPIGQTIIAGTSLSRAIFSGATGNN